MIFYQNKEQPWIHICTRKSKYEKRYFFRVRSTTNNKWMKWPRFHAMVNLFLFSFWRDNRTLRVGVGVGKIKYELVFAGIF